MRRLAALWLVLAALVVAAPALAVEPDEVLDDPVLEQRARGLSAGLRCLVCQNQSIDDSNATLARDLRILVRERLVAGDTDEQVIDFLVARYGDFILLKPPFNWGTALLWAMPALVLVIAGAVVVVQYRRRSAARAETRLTAEEEKALQKILAEDT